MQTVLVLSVLKNQRKSKTKPEKALTEIKDNTQDNNRTMKASPKIEEIKMTRKQQEELQYLLKRPSLTEEGRTNVIKKYSGGVCLICGDIPKKKITYNVDGAQVIERYCDKHFENKGF